MRSIFVIVLACASALALAADSPFPDNKKNHWVYQSMIQIKRDHLWYRTNDNVPVRPVRTRGDFATKTLFLAVDSEGLIDKFRQATAMVSKPSYDAATKKWVKQFVASFPKRKLVYQNYLARVTKLWNFFLPEIRPIAKKYKLNPKVIQENLALERITLNGLKVRGRK